MKGLSPKNSAGFSLVELMITMVILLLTMGLVSMLLSKAMGVRSRESRTTDALTTAQAALSVLSREISNSGFGLYQDSVSQLADNGIVIADSNANRIRVRANTENAGGTPAAPATSTLSIDQPGEDITYFFDAATSSIVRFDPNGGGTGTPQTSVVVSRISNITFGYFDYDGPTSAVTGPSGTPTANTSRVRISVDVTLDPVVGQPDNQTVTFESDVALRNSSYMLAQY